MALTSSPAQPEMRTLLTAYHRRLRWSDRRRIGTVVAVAGGLWWLALAVAYYVDWLPSVLLPGLAGTAALLIGAVLFDLRRRSSLAETARLLDVRLDNRQRLTTSVELLDMEAVGPLVQAQLATSAALLGRADPQAVVPARPSWPVAVVSGGLLLLALGLLILKQAPALPFGLGNLPSDQQGLAALPTATPAGGLPGSDPALPGNPAASPDDSTEPQQLGPGTDPISAAQQLASKEAKAALDRLAAALDEQSVTQAAADSLRQGQYGQAADQLTEVGKQSDQLSDTAKQGLAAALDRAAQDTPSPPELQQAEQNAVTALQSEDYGRISDALKALGDAVRQAGDRVITQPNLAKSYPDPSGQSGGGVPGGAPDSSGSGPPTSGQDATGAPSGQDATGAQPGQTPAQSNPSGDSGQGGSDQSNQSGSGDQSGQGGGQGQGDTTGTGAGDGQSGQTGASGTDSSSPTGTGASGGNPGEGTRVSGPDDTVLPNVAGTPFELQNQPDPNNPGPPDPNQPPGLTLDSPGGNGSTTTPLAPGAAGSAPSESNQVPVQRWEPVQRYFSHDDTK